LGTRRASSAGHRISFRGLEPCPISDIAMKTALRPSPTTLTGPRGISETGKMMRIWLEHDPVALAILVFGIAAVELLALSF